MNRLKMPCPECNRSIKYPESAAGRLAKCPSCQGKVLLEMDDSDNRRRDLELKQMELDARERELNIRQKEFHANESRLPPNQPQHFSQPAPVQQQVIVNTPVQRWSPLVAMLLSLIFPGLGQIYKGQPINGLVWIFVVIVGYICLIVPGMILHLCCIVGAAMGDPYK